MNRFFLIFALILLPALSYAQIDCGHYQISVQVYKTEAYAYAAFQAGTGSTYTGTSTSGSVANICVGIPVGTRFYERYTYDNSNPTYFIQNGTVYYADPDCPDPDEDGECDPPCDDTDTDGDGKNDDCDACPDDPFITDLRVSYYFFPADTIISRDDGTFQTYDEGDFAGTEETSCDSHEPTVDPVGGLTAEEMYKYAVTDPGDDDWTPDCKSGQCKPEDRDTDGDGIPDKDDDDDDGDGIPDDQDDDDDGDGIPDSIDPDHDSDGDGIPDKDDDDDDNDGIPDSIDKDDDGDGIPDDQDPDHDDDGDGKPDSKDPDYEGGDNANCLDFTNWTVWLHSADSFPFNWGYAVYEVFSPLANISPAPPVFDVDISPNDGSGISISTTVDFSSLDWAASIVRWASGIALMVKMLSWFRTRYYNLHGVS